FAWPVKPMMSAMMLGATYIGGAYFFTQVILARQWHTVRLGFIPVSTFAGILGISTLLHWDKFTQGHISFILWAILYFVLPFVIPVVWYMNQRTNRGGPDPRRGELPRSLCVTAGVLGGVMAAVSLVLLVAPQVMTPTWGWTLTPLTARIMSAMFALSGLVGLEVAYDRHWSSVRIVMQAQSISIVLILLAMLPTFRDIQWGGWGTWLFIGGLLVALGVNGWTFLASRKTALFAARSVAG
ncbi:MAG: hypothetical protein ACWGO1_15920, partial [Anaerolineales bacterium]